MKTVSKEVREMVISRFFNSFSELPHEVKKIDKADSWSLFECSSSNFTAIIGYKATPEKECCLWSIIS